MSDTQSIAEVLQGKPLSEREHQDPDKHWIGESIAIPTQTEIAATVGSVSGPGDSPFVARADHLHKLGTGVVGTTNIADNAVTAAKIANDVFPMWWYCNPTTGTAATTSSSFVTWLISDSVVTVPSWATSALLHVNLTNIYTTTAVAVYGLAATISGGSAYSGDWGVVTTAAASERLSLSFTVSISSVAAGARDLRIGARRASGSGVLTADASSKMNGSIFFIPA